MTHEYESAFHERVHAWLREAHPEAEVAHEHQYPATDRIADFLVRREWCTLAIEVENDANAVVKGVGQAMQYAAHHPNGVPVVVTPAGHVDRPEMDLYASATPAVMVELTDDGTPQPAARYVGGTEQPGSFPVRDGADDSLTHDHDHDDSEGGGA
jgi:hypothetical protein